MIIKSCPICGHSPLTHEYPIRGYEPEVEISIECSNPNCPLNKLPIASDTIYHKREEAFDIIIDKWNKQFEDINLLSDRSESECENSLKSAFEYAVETLLFNEEFNRQYGPFKNYDDVKTFLIMKGNRN